MALVVFTDSKGERWRVWNIDPGTLKHSSFLGEEFRTGWLCFESEISGERRRLSDVPPDWETLPPDRLELLCRAAASVTRRVPDEGAVQPDDGPRE